jgi:hypothetical protein
MADAHERNPRWIARLTPMPGTDIESLLQAPLGLDVWERNSESLVVRAYESQLKELERRRLATVERRITEEQYLSRKESDAEQSRP